MSWNWIICKIFKFLDWFNVFVSVLDKQEKKLDFGRIVHENQVLARSWGAGAPLRARTHVPTHASQRAPHQRMPSQRAPSQSVRLHALRRTFTCWGTLAHLLAWSPTNKKRERSWAWKRRVEWRDPKTWRRKIERTSRVWRLFLEIEGDWRLGSLFFN